MLLSTVRRPSRPSSLSPASFLYHQQCRRLSFGQNGTSGRCQRRQHVRRFHESGSFNAFSRHSPSTRHRQYFPLYQHSYGIDDMEEKRCTAALVHSSLDGRLSAPTDQMHLFLRCIFSFVKEGANPYHDQMSIAIEKLPNITTQDATLIALELLRAVPNSRAAWWILASSSYLGEPIAVLYTLGHSLFGDRNNDASFDRLTANATGYATAQLNKIGKNMDPHEPDRDWLMIKGAFAERHGRNPKEALHYYELAHRADPNNVVKRPPHAQSMLDSVILAPWNAVCRTRLKLGDRDGAREALLQGAFEMDAPQAYYLLARLFHDEDSDAYRDYMTKAAVSGVMPSVEAVGIYWMRRSNIRRAQEFYEKTPRPGLFTRVFKAILSQALPKGRIDKIFADTTVRDHLRLGVEWLSIATYEGLKTSRFPLAIALRELGHYQEGFELLDGENSQIYRDEWYKPSKFPDKRTLLYLTAREIRGLLGEKLFDK